MHYRKKIYMDLHTNIFILNVFYCILFTYHFHYFLKLVNAVKPRLNNVKLSDYTSTKSTKKCSFNEKWWSNIK